MLRLIIACSLSLLVAWTNAKIPHSYTTYSCDWCTAEFCRVRDELPLVPACLRIGTHRVRCDCRAAELDGGSCSAFSTPEVCREIYGHFCDWQGNKCVARPEDSVTYSPTVFGEPLGPACEDMKSAKHCSLLASFCIWSGDKCVSGG